MAPSSRRKEYSSSQQYDRIDRKINRLRHNEHRNRQHEEDELLLTNKTKNIKPKDIDLFLDE
jgi:hypothetical protein